MTAADQPGISWEQAIDTAAGALLDQEARRSSLAAREAAPTEYEREAVEVAALTLEDRYRKQIEELRQRFDEASAEVVRLFTLSASEGLRADAAEERVKELRDLETAARAAVAETKAYREANAARVGPMSAAFAAFVAAVDSLPPKPDTPEDDRG